ncbi:MAG: IS66 family insertion sequence element accessory protein TnpB [Gammaproteobacteria bacterium]|nr:IS66 family insertion sequence element accessory protein TnpB [Gammaproteobacteria bacterium]
MLQLSPQTRIFVAVEPVDFRKGIDGLSAVCRRHLAQDPLDGAVYVFRNRARTSIRLLCFDGQGYWLCTKRFSQGHLNWWPTSALASCRLSARELQILLWSGDPAGAGMADDWRAVA